MPCLLQVDMAILQLRVLHLQPPHCCPQVLGFLVLVSGTSLYNELIRGCLPSTSSLPDPEEDALQVTMQIQT